jgi:DinB superfamily
MEFNFSLALQILERTPQVVDVMLRNLDDRWTMANEGGESWSAYDIIGHYIHGERTDWLARTKIVLGNQEDKHFVPFDRFAQFTESRGKSVSELLDEFKRLRTENLKELRKIKFSNDTLSRTGIHPKFGQVTLQQLLSAWVVHDLTHIHQLSRVLAKQYNEAVGPWKEFLGVLNDR